MQCITEAHFSHSELVRLIEFWRIEFSKHDIPYIEKRAKEHDGGQISGGARGFQVTIFAAPDRCRVVLACEDAALLPDFRGHLEKHIAEFDPDLMPMDWSGEFGAGLQPPSFMLAKVTQCKPSGASWLRITARGEPEFLSRFAGENWHFRLLRPSRRGRPAVWPVMNARGTIDWPKDEDTLTDRVFTTYALDLAQGLLTFDIFRHEGGPTCDWAAAEPVGDTIGLMGPGGKGGPEWDKPGRILVGGDETAVPAILRSLRDSKNDHTATVHLLVKNAEDHQSTPAGLKVNWLYRDDGRTEADLVETIISHGRTGDNPERIWFAGSKSAARAVRAHARERLDLQGENTMVTAYWS